MHFQDQHLEKEKIKEEVTEINKVFFCEICNKQYTQALQYDQHLSSYDHHHKKVRDSCCCNALESGDDRMLKLFFFKYSAWPT